MAVAYPEEPAIFYRLDEYKGYLWTVMAVSPPILRDGGAALTPYTA
jgi:hypothetical protein